MVLYTVIGEYDVLYAQTRELKGLADTPRATLSTNPRDFLGGTALNSGYTNFKTEKEYYNEYN
ncbi:MAG: hypothetical protein NC395_01000 [Prevotella sp.]|nr:hypothetical protein [Prevotella sp.]